MSEQPAQPPPAPAHESLGHRLGDWFRHDAEPFAREAAAAIAPEVKAAVRAHAGQVLALAATLLADTGIPYAAEILALAEETARLAGAIHRPPPGP